MCHQAVMRCSQRAWRSSVAQVQRCLRCARTLLGGLMTWSLYQHLAQLTATTMHKPILMMGGCPTTIILNHKGNDESVVTTAVQPRDDRFASRCSVMEDIRRNT